MTEVADQPANDAPENLPQQNLLGVNIQINIQPASSIGDQSDRDLDSLQVNCFREYYTINSGQSLIIRIARFIF